MTSTKRPWRIGIGMILFEGNSQSPVVTNLDDFRNIMLAQGQEVFNVIRGTQTELAGAMELFSLFDVTPVPLIAANGNSGGRGTVQHLSTYIQC